MFDIFVFISSTFDIVSLIVFIFCSKSFFVFSAQNMKLGFANFKVSISILNPVELLAILEAPTNSINIDAKVSPVAIFLLPS